MVHTEAGTGLRSTGFMLLSMAAYAQIGTSILNDQQYTSSYSMSFMSIQLKQQVHNVHNIMYQAIIMVTILAAVHKVC